MSIWLARGKRLPRFNSLEEAEHELLRTRDHLLVVLDRVIASSAQFRLDSSPESLKELEKWYFKLLNREDDFRSVGLTRDELERAISMYLGAVLVANVSTFKWKVEEDALLKGRYEIGVGKPLLTLNLTLGSNLESRPNNKRQQSLWREFCQYAKA
jgi:hypothetical protein